jgi:hypothetical protein
MSGEVDVNTVMYESLQVLAGTLRGDPPRAIRSMGWWARTSRVGGPTALAVLFAPVSPDPQAAAGFMERHEAGMRAEVLAAVTRVLERWGEGTETIGDQSHVDDLVVALAHLRLMLRPRRGSAKVSQVAQQIFDISLAVQHTLVEDWFQPLIGAKLNSPHPPEAP